jgi:hypothetical protein
MSNIAEPVDMFPSTNAMALGFLQAEALWANDPSETSLCNTKDFTGASDELKFDVSENPLTPAVIGLGVTTGVLGVATLGVILFMIIRSAMSATPSKKGYSKLN